MAATTATMAARTAKATAATVSSTVPIRSEIELARTVTAQKLDAMSNEVTRLNSISHITRKTSTLMIAEKAMRRTTRLVDAARVVDSTGAFIVGPA
jgi:hypothetical protein